MCNTQKFLVIVGYLTSPPITDQMHVHCYLTNCCISHTIPTIYLLVARAENTLSIDIPLLTCKPVCIKPFHLV